MAVTSPKPKQSKAQVFGSPLKDKNKQTKKNPAGYHPKPDLCLPTSRANTTFVHHWVITPLEKATSQKLLAKRIHLNALFWGSKLSLLQIGEGSGWIKGNLQDRKGPGKKKKQLGAPTQKTYGKSDEVIYSRRQMRIIPILCFLGKIKNT